MLMPIPSHGWVTQEGEVKSILAQEALSVMQELKEEPTIA